MAADETPDRAPTPLVRAFEIWVPESDGNSLSIQTGFYRGSRLTPNHAPYVAALGLPVFHGDEVRAVVVLFN